MENQTGKEMTTAMKTVAVQGIGLCLWISVDMKACNRNVYGLGLRV